MMPKHLRSSSSHNRYGDAMPVSLAASTGGTGTPLYTTRMTMPTTTTYYSPMQASPSAAAAAVVSMPPQQSYDQYAVGAVPVTPVPQRASSGAWSPQDDQTLLTARAQGLNWSQIQQSYFQSKSANACRKRHERLMERKGADDWDARKFEQLAKEYMAMRKEIWSGLAARTGEKWNVVESKCMSHGLKNIQSAARAGARRERLESGHPLPAGYDDDGGIGGVGLTPVDDLDHSYRDASYHSSPGGSSGAGSHHSGSSAASVSGGGYASATMHSLQPFSSHSYTYSSGPHHGYTSSVSSTGTTAGPYGGPVSQPGGSPYLDHHSQRLPSVDMGIDAIINRPGGALH